MSKRDEQITLGWGPNGYAAAAITLGVILFLALNIFASITFRSARVDLTQQGLFTLSEGTRDTLARLEEPITLRFYYSEALLADHQSLSSYGTRVRSILEEYANHAGGNLRLEVIDPEPFSEEEDEAMALGLQPGEIGGEQVFFGLVATNTIDGQEVVPFFLPSRQEFLEYDLTQIISRLNETQRPVLGIVTNLPLDTGNVGFDAIQQGVPAQPYYVYQQLLASFEIDFLEQDFDAVPEDVDVLMIVHPRELDDQTLYAIDQFVMRGGRVLAFVDPYSEVAMRPGPTGQPLRGATESSNLSRLMSSWGVEMQDGVFVGDRATGELVPANFDPRRAEVTYVAWLTLGPEFMTATDPVTGPLQRGLNMGTVGALTPTEGATTTFLPLVTTSEESMLIPVEEVQYGADMDRLLREFVPAGEPFTVAARVTGEVQSAFPDGPPLSEEDGNAEDDSEAPAEGQAADTSDRPGAEAEDQTQAVARANHLEASVGPISVIVVADTDLLDDTFYVQEQGYGGASAGRVGILDNDALVLNAVDYLIGANDLLSLRARAIASRPFTVVDNLRRRAEERFLEAYERLQNELTVVEQRMRELRGQTRDQDIEVSPELDERRREELQQFQQRYWQIREEMRGIQRSLRTDIERLAFQIKAINIVLMPVIIALIALGLVVWHRMRRARRLRGAA